MRRLGVDTGGTFTDFVLLDDETGVVQVWKHLTTPEDPSIGILKGSAELLAQHGVRFSDVAQVVHGMTIGANVVIERKGARTALITTRGFRDTLHLGRQKRYDLYDLFIDKPTPLVPRYLVKEVSERIAYDGRILTPLDEGEVRVIVRDLLNEGVRSIAVCLLHAYANPVHERRIAEIIKEEAGDLAVSLSSEIAPLYREYERTSTTVINAYIMPAVRDYVDRLTHSLREEGLEGTVYLMQSSGGIGTAETMARQPVKAIESGPAAGVLMAIVYGRLAGERDVISFDMGGTTAKVSLIERGRPHVSDECEIDKIRLRPGSGLPVNVPTIDMIEIGAGGGSIAQIHLGIIKVGPESAGADPGPICYGFGGTRPTVTDADLVLGYLNPDYFLGGRMRLDVDGARRGIEESIASPLGLDAIRAAWGIHEIVTSNMAAATRAVSVERGRDPRDFSLVAFGGAGPIHATRLARMIGIRRVILPAAAGVASALGLLAADVKFELVRTSVARWEQGSLDLANELFRDLEEQGLALLRQSLARGDQLLLRSADMRYVGQGYQVNIPVPSGRLSTEHLAALRRAFDDTYATIYGYSDASATLEVVNWKVTAVSPQREISLPTFERAGRNLGDAAKTARPVYFPEAGGFVECAVYDRHHLFEGAAISGPAVVEERESTTLLLPGDVGTVDVYGNLIVTASMGG
ncbi:MAG: hydantoinase/oxoprolinase family protein [Armatimonadetes bacterium]|nr:hydantoinase/oxoprolinase family protein [Armatimonadota bacterium]